MAHIFISYSRDDTQFRRHLQSLLQEHGFDVWIDEGGLQAGVNWWDEIERHIQTCAAFFVVMSEASKKSIMVQNEILIAINKKRNIYPVWLNGEPFSILGYLQYEDMRLGLEATLPKHLVQRLRETIPNNMNKPSEKLQDDFIVQSIQQIEQLFSENQKSQFDYVPAAVLLGTVLEYALRKLCLENDIRPRALSFMVRDLTEAKLLSDSMAKQLLLWISMRNHAAHGNFAELTRKDVEQMLSGIKYFLSNYP